MHVHYRITREAEEAGASGRRRGRHLPPKGGGILPPKEGGTLLNKGYDKTLSALEELSADSSQPKDSQCVSHGLIKNLKKLEFAVLLELWDALVGSFQKTSLCLQSPDISINTAITLLTSLLHFVKERRSEFVKYERLGESKCPSVDFKPIHKKKYRFDDNRHTDTVFTPRDRFRCEVFMPLIDHLASSLQTRIDAYVKVNDLFGFFGKLHNMKSSDIETSADNLISTYPNDFECTLSSELSQFAEIFRCTYPQDHKPESIGDSIEMKMFQLLNDFKQTFPNVLIAMRIYLSLMSSNCTGERSFSKLKRIKNDLRSTMGQERLTHLSLMSIEHGVLTNLDFDDLVTDFARRKFR